MKGERKNFKRKMKTIMKQMEVLEEAYEDVFWKMYGERKRKEASEE